MSYMEAIKSGYSNYAKFNGRASRSEFWWFFLFYAVVIFIVNFIVDLTGLPIIISVLVWASFVLPMLGLYFGAYMMLIAPRGGYSLRLFL